MMYSAVRALVKAAAPFVAPLEIEGVDHVPASGPFILALNHASLLDGVAAQAACPRVVHTMVKSSEFGSPVVGRMLVALNAFPVRRYRIDPQAVRTVLRLLGEGRAVGIYPEAERSWDGRGRAFRRGAIRLLLKAGVPVVPCGISGSYDVWPRWSRGPVRGPITVRFGPALSWGRHDTREARAEAFEGASGALRAAWDRLFDTHQEFHGEPG